MRKKLGLILIVIAVAGLVFSFTFEIREYKCCSCDAGWKLGSGVLTLIKYSGSIRCGSCHDYLLDNPVLGCQLESRIIPVEFIVLSALIGWLGIKMLRGIGRNGGVEPLELEKPKEE